MKTIKRKPGSKLLQLLLTLIIFASLTANSYTQPKESWVKRIDKFENDEKVVAMKTDNEDNIYLTGYTVNENLDKDFMTVKLSSDGEELWSAFYKGESNIDGNDDIVRAMTLDRDGNVYVTGSTHGGVRGRDIITIKYDKNGKEQFTNIYYGSPSMEDSDDESVDIALDGFGNFIVAGNCDGNICIIKYRTNGEPVWSRILLDNNFNEIVKFLKVDTEGNIMISGVSNGITSHKDYLTVKLSARGNVLWRQTYNGVGGNTFINDDEINAMEIDDQGNVYVTGYSYGLGTGADFLTLKYNTNGNVIWESRNSVGFNHYDVIYHEEAIALAVDEIYNVYITGISYSDFSPKKIFTVKLNSIGETVWKNISTNKSNESLLVGEPTDIETDNMGNIYITGYGNYSKAGKKDFQDHNYLTFKYNSRGEEIWFETYSGFEFGTGNENKSRAISLCVNGDVLVAGESKAKNLNFDLCVIKYSENYRNNENEKLSSANKNVTLNENYPNPFNPVTMISFELPVPGKVKLSVFDITGREVSVLANTQLNTGIHEFSWNAASFSSGTYFYRLEVNGQVITKRMSLIK